MLECSQDRDLQAWDGSFYSSKNSQFNECYQGLHSGINATEPLILATIFIQSDNQAKIKLENLPLQRSYWPCP